MPGSPEPSPGWRWVLALPLPLPAFLLPSSVQGGWLGGGRDATLVQGSQRSLVLYNRTNLSLPEANVELKIICGFVLNTGSFPPILNSASSFPKLTDFFQFFFLLFMVLLSPDVFS